MYCGVGGVGVGVCGDRCVGVGEVRLWGCRCGCETEVFLPHIILRFICKNRLQNR